MGLGMWWWSGVSDGGAGVEECWQATFDQHLPA